MSHDYHDVLPGFDSGQVLVDGCGECEARSACADHGISSLDSQNFARAMARAKRWNLQGLPTISEAEVPLLTTLWSVWVQLERAGGAAFAFATAGAS